MALFSCVIIRQLLSTDFKSQKKDWKPVHDRENYFANLTILQQIVTKLWQNVTKLQQNVTKLQQNVTICGKMLQNCNKMWQMWPEKVNFKSEKFAKKSDLCKEDRSLFLARSWTEPIWMINWGLLPTRQNRRKSPNTIFELQKQGEISPLSLKTKKVRHANCNCNK